MSELDLDALATAIRDRTYPGAIILSFDRQHYAPGNMTREDVLSLIDRVREAEAKSALDEQQCDEMTATTARLAERVTQLKSAMAVAANSPLIHVRLQYILREALRIVEKDASST